MIALVSDILQLSELDSTQASHSREPVTEMAPVDLAALVKETAQNMTVNARRAYVTLQYDARPATVRGSRDQLSELTQNLCDNAIRYNRPGGHVELRCGVGGDGCPYFEVEDNGIGIPQDSQTRVFERFYRVDKSRSKATGAITTEFDPDAEPEKKAALLPEIAAYAVVDAVKAVTCREAVTYEPTAAGAWGDTPLHVALLDLGCKNNIVRCLQKRGCRVTVLPGTTTAAELAALNPDGLMLSNGPGDPAENVEIIANIREMLSTGIPTFGICLGHQLTALAAGAKTCKLKYGHRGANQPVTSPAKQRTFITSQNHGYAVMADTLPESVGQMSYFNANDGTCEGVDYLKWNCFTVQFHPEANGGPKDTEFLFDQFVSRMLAAKGVINNA